MIEVTIKTEENVSIYISEWDDGGAWIRLGYRHGSAYAVMTRSEAEKMLETLQAVLAKEVAV